MPYQLHSGAVVAGRRQDYFCDGIIYNENIRYANVSNKGIETYNKGNKKQITMILLDIANGWKTAIMIVAMIAVFYLFLIKPQSDKTKKEAAYRDSLKAGDELMTAGGIHVKFVSRDGAYAVVEAAPGVKMKVQIATLQPVPERKRS